MDTKNIKIPLNKGLVSDPQRQGQVCTIETV